MYKVENLRVLVRDCLETEFELYKHAKKQPEVITKNYTEWEREFDINARSANLEWLNFSISCDMVNADENKVIAVEKSIRRHQVKTNWQNCISFDTNRAQESYRRAVKKIF